MKFDWTKLQNGSDIRGYAIDSPKQPANLSADTAQILGHSFATWLIDALQLPASQLKVAVGIDSRITGPALKEAFAKGLNESGIEVLDAGLATTPAMFMSTQFGEFACQGGVMITASHLPPNRNGFKFFTAEGGLGKTDITDILSIAANQKYCKSDINRQTRTCNLMEVYAQFIVKKIQEGTGNDQPLAGLNIIIDAGNGAGGFFDEHILKVLGADTTGSLFLEPDGNFPNHSPNPEDPVAMQFLQDAVLQQKADLGIIFDTDVDRAAIVDKQGKAINRNRLIALISRIILAENPGSNIVTDSVTSDGLAEFIEAHGGKHHRFKRGYKNVINEAIELNRQGEPSFLAIETSGHAALKENFFLDDGAFLIAKILIELANLKQKGKNLEDLLEGLREPIESKEFRIDIELDDFASYGKEVIEQLRKSIDQQEGWCEVLPNHEGVRVAFDQRHGDGWMLLRLSLHDPVLPMNIESSMEGGVEMIKNQILPFLKSFAKLNVSSLIN